MKLIKHITVATDFSITSKNAFTYATQLANKLNAKITVIHVQEHTMSNTEVNVSAPAANDLDLVKRMTEFVFNENAFVDPLITNPETAIRIVSGSPLDFFVGLSKNGGTDLIIMGTTGLSDVLTKIFGSTSQKISSNAHCPVMLVPRDLKWSGIKRLAFASNYESLTAKFVQEVSDFAGSLNSDLHFVNVKNFDPVFETPQKEVNWEGLSAASFSNINFEKHTIYGNDTIEQLQKFGTEKNIDLMVFVSERRNFWESLIHRSITENMALSLDTIPLMVFHLKD